MADEPVSAWREPLARRALRWARRNRTAVASAAVALLAGVVGLAAVLAVQTRAKGAIARALVNETRANAALSEANQRVEAAVRAGDRGDQDLSHGRQRGLPAQGGEVQGPAPAALDVGGRLLRPAGRPAGPGDGLWPRDARSIKRPSSWPIDREDRPEGGCALGPPAGAVAAAGACVGAGGRGRDPRRRGPQPHERRIVAGGDREDGRGAGSLPRGRAPAGRTGALDAGNPVCAGGLSFASRLVPLDDRPLGRGAGRVPSGACPTRNRWPNSRAPPTRPGATSPPR